MRRPWNLPVWIESSQFGRRRRRLARAGSRRRKLGARSAGLESSNGGPKQRAAANRINRRHLGPEVAAAGRRPPRAIGRGCGCGCGCGGGESGPAREAELELEFNAGWIFELSKFEL